MAIAVSSALVLSGCAVTISGEPIAAGNSRTAPRPLPFNPTIKERTNDRTDGTSFEPCAAYTESELRALDINPTSIEDAAKVDSANYRGCHWRANDYTVARGGGDYSQVVGREMTLDDYKRYMNSLPWQTDHIVHGRHLAIAIENNYCIAAFASDESIVTTTAASTNPSPGRTVECARAVAFASLAITKAP
ncbi:DUF3558 domain-containing protein [Tsukamurella pseudospumae]|uniref:DUF3558 domain-containing protein n=1 Tax=Tsukamurella pseudospumae TaxID=239498 RepID=UPI001FD39BE3|nr:DUF3558 domain-containing protein [Tsukamurella pseudospumae]